VGALRMIETATDAGKRPLRWTRVALDSRCVDSRSHRTIVS
jgi:hypothetical protein